MVMEWFIDVLLSFSGTLVAILFLLLFFRPLTKWLVARFTKRLMSDRYPENIWEMITAVIRINPRIVVENSLRAASGKVIERPFGSARKVLHFDGLIFSPAQLAVPPAAEHEQVKMQVTIGPQAKKPLHLQIPLLLGAMGYGVALSEKMRLAMAKGTATVGTATNVGEGGFLPEDRQQAKHLILQYHSGTWSKKPEILRQADAIEIHIGQGASATATSRIPPEYVQGKARDIMGLKVGETAVLPSRLKEVNQPQDLHDLTQELRHLTGGVPIGVKMAAGHKLEAELDVVIDAGVDFIALDGGQAGTKGAGPILEDDFGLPTIYALCRAVRHLNKRGVREKISLLVGGGFATPGECLKALALGADAVYMGTAALWAMTHTQVSKTLPFEPPTQVAMYWGNMQEELDEEEAAHYLSNFFKANIEEMKVAILALGKTSVQSVNAEDLVALDEQTSRVTRIPLAYDPYPHPRTDFDIQNERTKDPNEDHFLRQLFSKLVKK